MKELSYISYLLCICVAFLLAYTVVLLYDIFSFRIRFIGISNYRDMIELLVNTLLVNRDVEAHFFPSCLQVRKNVLDVSYHISQYQNIISELRGEIGRLKEKIQSEAVFGGPSSGVKKAELQEMREQMVTNFKEQMNLRYS